MTTPSIIFLVFAIAPVLPLAFQTCRMLVSQPKVSELMRILSSTVKLLILFFSQPRETNLCQDLRSLTLASYSWVIPSGPLLYLLALQGPASQIPSAPAAPNSNLYVFSSVGPLGSALSPGRELGCKSDSPHVSFSQEILFLHFFPMPENICLTCFDLFEFIDVDSRRES